MGVTFVDRAGVRTLRRLNRKGVEIRCRPGPVASVLEGEGIRVTQDGVDDERPECSWKRPDPDSVTVFAGRFEIQAGSRVSGQRKNVNGSRVNRAFGSPTNNRRNP